MSGKSLTITDKSVVVDSFEATDNGENISFSITRTADGGEATGTIVTLFGKPSPVSIVDSDSGTSGITFTLADGQISEYHYFTREAQPAVESFKLQGKQITVK